MNDEVVVRAEKKSNLFDPIFTRLPYPIASGIVRGLRAFFSIVMPYVIGIVLDGSVFTQIHVIPQGYIPLIVAISAPIILGIDKWLREKGLEDDVKDVPISLVGTGPADTDTEITNP